MKDMSKREKIMVGIIIFLFLVIGSTGCTDTKPKTIEDGFVKSITVKPIQVETIQVEKIEVETILTEDILYEDVSTYWD